MKKQYVGGYLTLKSDFVKSGIHQHTAGLEDPVSDLVLEAVNTIQATPWRINKFVLGVLQECLDSGDHLGGLPAAEDMPMPARLPDEVWDTMSPAERMEYKLQLATVHGENASRAGKWAALYRKAGTAAALAKHERIWFPHALDFRGRIYPLPQDLNPQGDDVAKALLEFADAKPLTERGVMWLEIAIANAAGQDKLTLEDRVKWTHEHAKLIVDSGMSPLDGARLWCSEGIDEPWRMLALCKEYLGYMIQGPTYESRLPINLDGSCNGLQHLSAMGLDPVGARATNLVADDVRHDCYAEVAKRCAELVSADAAQGNEVAVRWAGNITRATVKRAVMTTPYGVTHRGIRDQLISDKIASGVPGNPMENASYLTEKIRDALSETVSSAKAIMGYFQEVARVLSERDIPFQWVAPSGMKVSQTYWRINEQKVSTLYGSVRVYREAPGLGLDNRKQALAAAPNVVHSFDAAHLALTVTRLNEIAPGQMSYAFVHDSYGCHAADVDLLSQVLRDEFAEMYSVNRLEEFDAVVRSYCPEDIELPPVPERGTFDLEQVRTSKYFFA